jgi:hypothetical protein
MRSAALLLVLAMLLGSTAIVFAGGGKSCCCLLKAGAMCPMRGTAKMCGATACSMRQPDGWTLTAQSMTAMPPAVLVRVLAREARADARLAYADSRAGARPQRTQSPEPPPPKRA